MMYKIIIIIAMNALNSESRYLTIQHYDNVTLRSCGWSSHSFETANTKCFSWHKTYKQIRAELSIANIRGGRDAKIGEFPYNALIKKRIWINENRKAWIECSGAIINSKWIVTAAHCLKNDHASNYSVFVGFTIHPKYSKQYKPMNVTHTYLHPNYRIGSKDYDIGLIKLNTEIDFRSDSLNSVCLPGNAYEIGRNSEEYGIVCGWGDTNPNQSNDKRLKTLEIRLNAKQTENWIIESSRTTSGVTCIGDSGGPLVKLMNKRSVLIGIYSGKRIRGCIESDIIFASVPNMVNWIVDTVRSDL